MTPELKQHFTVGGQTVYGRFDELTLAAGFAPNKFCMFMPGAEYEKIKDHVEKPGKLEIFFSDPTKPDLTLDGWFVVDVYDDIVGVPVGKNSTEVLQCQVFLSDRRYEFQCGRSGVVQLGVFNKKEPGGLKVKNANFSAVAKKQASRHYIMQKILKDLHNWSGLPSLNDIPPGMADVTPPENFNCDGVPAITALNDLCFSPSKKQQYCQLAVGMDAKYRLYMIGDKSPSYPADNHPGLLPYTDNNCDIRSGKYIVVTASEPNQKTETNIQIKGLPNQQGLHFEYCGVDTDGSIKPVNDLSYIKDYAGDAVDFFKNFEKSPCGNNLESRLFTIIKLAHPDSDELAKYLPMLRKIPPKAGDNQPADSIHLVGQHIKASNEYDYYGTTTSTKLYPERVDLENGILDFGQHCHLGTMSNIAEFVEDTFEPYNNVNGPIVKFAHVVRDGTIADRYYSKAYTRDANGNVTEVDLSVATAKGAKTTYHVIDNFWREENGAVNNETRLNELSLNYAKQIFAGETKSSTRTLKGLHAINCDGVISAVTWDFQKMTTQYEVNGYQNYHSRTLYAEEWLRLVNKVNRVEVTANNSAARAKSGTDEIPDTLAPGYVNPMLKPSRPTFLRAKAQEDFDAAKGYIVAKPVNYDSTVKSEADALHIFAYSVDGYAAEFIDIKQDDIVTYVKLIDKNQNDLFITFAAPISGRISTVATLTPGTGKTLATDKWQRIDQPDNNCGVEMPPARQYFDGDSGKMLIIDRPKKYDSLGMLSEIGAEKVVCEIAYATCPKES